MLYYCVKCKNKTETASITSVMSTNNRPMLKGICTVCGSKKASFVSNKSGGGFNLNSLVNNLPLELHQFAEKGEDVPGGSFNNQQKYLYCGPGTKYEQRNREGYKGINKLDGMCKLHDRLYDNVQRKDANFISGVMKTKTKLGLGVKSKSKKAKN